MVIKLTLNIHKSINAKNYLEILVVILISISPLISNPLKILLAACLILVNLKYIKYIKKGQIVVLFLFLSIFILGFTKDVFEARFFSDFSPLNIYYPICFLLSCLIAIKYGKNNFLYIIEKITFIIAIISIIGYFSYLLYPNIINYLLSYNYYNTTHKTAILFNVLTVENYIVLRNTGVASEPGLYQLLLNIALYTYLKNTAKISNKKVLVYSIAIITTASTAGLIAFAFIIFRFLFNNIKTTLSIIIFMVIFSPILYDQILYQFQNKLFGSYAFETRYEPFENTLEIAKNNILGLGNTGYNYYFNGFIQPSFDSYTQVFVRYGYGMLLLILLLLFNIGIKDKIIFIILLITFTSQGVWFVPLVAVLYFLYLDENKRKGLNDLNYSK